MTQYKLSSDHYFLSLPSDLNFMTIYGKYKYRPIPIKISFDYIKFKRIYIIYLFGYEVSINCKSETKANKSHLLERRTFESIFVSNQMDGYKLTTLHLTGKLAWYSPMSRWGSGRLELSIGWMTPQVLDKRVSSYDAVTEAMSPVAWFNNLTLDLSKEQTIIGVSWIQVLPISQLG